MIKDFCVTRISLAAGLKRGRVERDTPELAIPYSLPAFMARCAFASLVDAIIFIDYARQQLNAVPLSRTKRQPTLVIFSMFLTDLSRSSISRRVAMLRAFWGAAP